MELPEGGRLLQAGWLDEAKRYYETAVQMDPGNPEYRQALAMAEGPARLPPHRLQPCHHRRLRRDISSLCAACACMNLPFGAAVAISVV